MENATPTEAPATETPETPTPAPAPAAAERAAYVVNADITGARSGSIVSLTPAQAELHTGSVRPATPSDLAVFGRAPAQLD